MSVLPQLEHELLTAHERRRRSPRGPRLAGVLPLAGAAVAVGVAVLAIVLPGRRAATPPAGPSTPEVLLAHVAEPVLYATGGRIYVAESAGASGGQIIFGLGSPGRGRAGAGAVSTGRRRFHDRIDAVELAGNALWLTTTSGAGVTRLWRLRPDSLVPAGPPARLYGSGTGDFVGSMAVAGGRLWVGNGDTLVPVSLTSGRPQGEPTYYGTFGLGLAAGDGVLFVSGASTRAFLERRRPPAQAAHARLVTFPEGNAPAIAGVAGGGIWIVRFDGVRLTGERLDAQTLAPSPGAVRITGTKGLSVAVTDGILWVSDVPPAGGRAPGSLNYCGDPRTGRPRAALRAPAGGQFLTADARYVYYAVGASGAPQELVRVPIDPRCL
ncbi:MAG TPA: hypothetical protein VE992_01845 [Solirubrobacteraceae bacterium]|nr:hypothetical protein [Solirubrobacteraceae bacterium]